MSNAGAQAHAFYDEVARSGIVYSICYDDDEGGHPCWMCDIDNRQFDFDAPDRQKASTRPVWSSRSRVERHLEGALKQRGESFKIVAWDWETFVSEIARPIEKENGRLGINWAGPKMKGYNLTVQWVIDAVERRRGGPSGERS